MKSLDLKKADFLANEIEYLNSYLLSSKAAYFPPPIAATLPPEKIGYTSDLISIIDSEQKAATLLNDVLEKKRQEIYKAALALDLIPNRADYYPPSSHKISTRQPVRPKHYENPAPSNTLSVDHNRLKHIAEHEKRHAELKENTHPVMEIRQIVFLLMPDIDANQEREALAKAIIESVKHGYLKLEWAREKEGFIYQPFNRQIEAWINVEAFTNCANAGWLGSTAPAMALQWHSYLVKPKSALLIPPESNTDDLKRRDKQVEALLKVIEKISMNTQTLTVGGGNKQKIHDACVCEYPQLFTSSIHTFNGIWQAALKKGVIKIAENSRAKDKVVRKNH